MTSNNFRGRKLVQMVTNAEIDSSNVEQNELASTITMEMEPIDLKAWACSRDITVLQPMINPSQNFNELPGDLGDISISEYSFSKDESFGSLLCNEIIMESPVADQHEEHDTNTTPGNETVNKEINKNRPEELMKETGTTTTELHQQIIQTDCVLQRQENESDVSMNVTKKGTPRIRKRFIETVKTRKEVRKQRKLEKFCVKPACTTSCKKKCSDSFSDADRFNINNTYWKLNYESQGQYIQSLVAKQRVCRRIRASTLSRNNTFKYFLDKGNGKVEVCKIFFLTTLGYHKKNDRRILDSLKKPIDAQADKRGNRKHKDKIDRNILKNHIESFRPAVAHYRRIHAPNRRYLPSDLNATVMYKDFIEKYPHIKISYELYRRFLKKDMNISFTLLGNEECEECEGFKIHQPTCQDPASCDTCNFYKLHKIRYEMARKLYQEDVDSSTKFINKAFYSADLQKVIMLPRIDMFKAVIFCPRIIAFNESFVPLGSSKTSSLPFAAIWHEAISGRKQEDIISAFRAFFISKRDCTDITVWTDNCSSQNKNWAFFTFLVHIINSSLINAKSIVIKYLESGHTFMSADNFHHQVENQLQKAKKVYDFSDFIDCVQMSNSGKVTVKAMEVTDFFKYVDQSSQHKLKKNINRIYLKDIVYVEVRRQNFNLFVKTGYDCEIREMDFLKLKLTKSKSIPDPIQNTIPRGITEARKSAILKTLSKLIPPNRLPFWQNLYTDNNSTDLVNVLDVQE